MAKIFYYVFISLNLILISNCSANMCINKNPCLCLIDEYNFINVSSLQPQEHDFFSDSILDSVSYYFAGCKDKEFDPKTFNLIANKTWIGEAALFKCNSSISNSNMTINNNTIIISNILNQTCNPIGLSKDIKFEKNPSTSNDYEIIFSDNNRSILPRIHLICDNYARTDLKIINKDVDELLLYSPSVCIQHKEHHELSRGSIFCIIFFITAFLYFVGGGLIMYFVRGARGVETIPNFDFWSSLPGLMKDGLMFMLNGCRPFTVSTAETYDRI